MRNCYRALLLLAMLPGIAVASLPGGAGAGLLDGGVLTPQTMMALPSILPSEGSLGVMRTPLFDAADTDIDQLRRSASDGDAEAQYWLGLYLEYGVGVERDSVAASGWYQRAADQQHAGAQAALGVALTTGAGGEQDVARGIALLERAAAQGNEDAAFELGMVYLRGDGGQPDLDAAARWFQRALDDGDHYGAAGMGLVAMARNDFAAARRWFVSAEQQDGLAIGTYGRGLVGLAEANNAEQFHAAIALLRQAAEAGDVNARLLLATSLMFFADQYPPQMPLTSASTIAEWQAWFNALPDTISNEAFGWMREAADDGDVRALGFLGFSHLFGVGQPLDRARGTRYVKAAAGAGMVKAQILLGYLYLDKQSPTADDQQARHWLLRAAQRGDVRAQIAIAEMLVLGMGGPVDAVEGARWMRIAADSGDALAQFELAELHSDGFGVEQDMAEFQRLVRLAAAQGHVGARLALAASYIDGHGVKRSVDEGRRKVLALAMEGEPKAWLTLARWEMKGLLGTPDAEKARIYLLKVADTGTGKDIYEAAWAFETGDVVVQDYALANSLYERAGEHGYVPAINALGVNYKKGIGVDPDLPRALALYRRAAELGDSAAMLNLGNAFMHGTGVEQDYQVALSWFYKSAALNNGGAENNISHMYSNGWGVEPDVERELYWLRRALEHGNIDATYGLGKRYLFGLAVKQDIDRGVALLERSIAGGNPAAAAVLGQALVEGKLVEQDYERAFTLFKAASGQDFPVGNHRLAMAYLYGRGTAKDTAAAEALLLRASEQGVQDASSVLGWEYLRGGIPDRPAATGLALLQAGVDEGNHYAMFLLAKVYTNGLGVKRNFDLALELAQRAAVDGVADFVSVRDILQGLLRDGRLTHLQLGVDYLNGSHNSVVDFERAARHLEKAAAEGSAEAMRIRGVMYMGVLGLEKDIPKAIPWLRKASNAGSGAAAASLASLYWEGNGVPTDACLGGRYFRRAAELGKVDLLYFLMIARHDHGCKLELPRSMPAMVDRLIEGENKNALFATGMFFVRGEGVPKDLKTGYRLLERAAELGYAEAQVWVGIAYDSGGALPKDLARAAQLDAAAAAQGNINGINNYGYFLMTSPPPWRDQEQAYRWFVIAARSGHSNARKSLLYLQTRLSDEQKKRATREAERWIAEHGAPAPT